jgi:predicted small secreted protein
LPPRHWFHATAFRRAKKWEHHMVRKILEVTLIAGTLLLAACNTISGAGKDVSSVGKTVSNTADDAK